MSPLDSTGILDLLDDSFDCLRGDGPGVDDTRVFVSSCVGRISRSKLSARLKSSSAWLARARGAGGGEETLLAEEDVERSWDVLSASGLEFGLGIREVPW